MWQGGGEAFIQRTCETNPITIIELKEKPECEKVEKVELDKFHSHTLQHVEWKWNGLNILLPLNCSTNQEVCEKMWIPEAPFWKDTNCQ